MLWECSLLSLIWICLLIDISPHNKPCTQLGRNYNYSITIIFIIVFFVLHSKKKCYRKSFGILVSCWKFKLNASQSRDIKFQQTPVTMGEKGRWMSPTNTGHCTTILDVLLGSDNYPKPGLTWKGVKDWMWLAAWHEHKKITFLNLQRSSLSYRSKIAPDWYI